jgi:hypothetical protein
MDTAMTNSASKRKREEDDEGKRLANAKAERRARKKAKQSQVAPAEVASAIVQTKEDTEQGMDLTVPLANGTNGISLLRQGNGRRSKGRLLQRCGTRPKLSKHQQ